MPSQSAGPRLLVQIVALKRPGFRGGSMKPEAIHSSDATLAWMSAL